MTSYTTEQFRKCFSHLPGEIQEKAKDVYRIWILEPFRKSLNFKRIHSHKPIYSVRIGLKWRALCFLKEDTAIWFWIGSHSAYDKLISKL